MDTGVRELDPTVNITVGNEDVKGYKAPDNTVSSSFVLPSNMQYEVTAVSTTDPNWVRVKWKTTGQGGQIEYHTVWAHLGLNDDGTYNMSGTTAKDKKTLADIAYDINKGIGVDAGVDNSDDMKALLVKNYGDTYVYDKSHISTRNNPDTDEYLVTYADDASQNLDADYDHYLLLAVKAYGAPPQTTMYADPRIMSLKTSFGPTVLIGRKFADVIVSNPTIISLCPGVIKYNSIFAQAAGEKTDDSIIEYVKQALSSDANGKICEFQPCWYSSVKDQDGYIKYVNALNWISAIAMSRQQINDDGAQSLADRQFPGDKSGSTYRTFDWINYDTPDNDVSRLFSGNFGNIGDYVSGLVDKAQGIAQNALDGTLGDEVTSALSSYKYINFYCSGSNNVTEQFETSVRSSSIEDSINGTLSSTLKDVAFFTGGVIGDAAEEDIVKWANETSETLGINAGLLKNATELFSGGRIVFPQIVDDCTYGKECTFTVRFIAGSGNCEARYLMRCEFNHLLAFVLPKQLKGKLDMYTTPFLVRAVCRGRFSCEMGVITNVRVTYGGQDDMAWTADGQPTEMEVSFSITPLYSKLYMTSCDQLQGMFLKNTGMIEYLLVNSAVDLRIPQLEMKLDIIKGMADGYVTSKLNPENLFEKISHSKFVSSLRNIMNF